MHRKHPSQHVALGQKAVTVAGAFPKLGELMAEFDAGEVSGTDQWSFSQRCRLIFQSGPLSYDYERTEYQYSWKDEYFVEEGMTKPSKASDSQVKVTANVYWMDPGWDGYNTGLISWAETVGRGHRSTETVSGDTLRNDGVYV